MKRISKNKGDDKWLKALGANIECLIKAKGYASVYDFWVRKAGDHISRASLNYIVAGKGDPKISTLKILATLLKTDLTGLFFFDKR